MEKMVSIFFMMLATIGTGLVFGNDHQSGLTIRLHNGEPYGAFPLAELLLIDPQNRKTGYDSISKTFYSEIPESSYEAVGLDDELTTKDLDIRRPAAGDYQLYVIGKNKGGYIIDIAKFNTEGDDFKVFRDISIESNEVHVIRIQLAEDVNAKLLSTLNMKGRAPKAAPTFLGYKTLGKHTALPEGSKSYKIEIVYGDNILPLSFKAKHNGVDITHLFHPVPGRSESVTIILSSENNTLTFSVTASLDGSIVEDTDYFVLTRK